MTDSWPIDVYKKNTATRQSLAFWGAMRIWVVISSPHAFSARGYCVTTCTSPHVFFRFSSPLSPFPPSIQLSIPLTHLTTYSYLSAILEQPRASLLPAPLDTLVPLALFAAGQTFVITSTWSLGITGTFLGDYFGILMDSRVEGFPFNVLRDPMYVGSTMCFAATALWCVLPCLCGFAVMRLTFLFSAGTSAPSVC